MDLNIISTVNTIYEIPLGKAQLNSFLSNPRNFETYMPGVRELKYVKTDETGAKHYIWNLKIDIPLLDPVDLKIPTEFIREDKEGKATTIRYFSKDNTDENQMLCHLELSEIDSDNTEVNMYLKIVIKKVADQFYPLIAILGDSIIQAQMKTKMNHITESFLQQGVQAIYSEMGNFEPRIEMA